jgi:hypothetical protein
LKSDVPHHTNVVLASSTLYCFIRNASKYKIKLGLWLIPSNPRLNLNTEEFAYVKERLKHNVIRNKLPPYRFMIILTLHFGYFKHAAV